MVRWQLRACGQHDRTEAALCHIRPVFWRATVAKKCSPGYVASSFSSLRKRCLISGLSSWAAGPPGPKVPPSLCPLLASSAAFAVAPSFLSSCSSLTGAAGAASWSLAGGGGGGLGDAARLGSSLSSMTKAASKTAGSGFGAESTAASADGFLGRVGRPPVARAPLRRRDDAEPDLDGVLLSEMVFCRACSSAMVRSMAPLIFCGRSSARMSCGRFLSRPARESDQLGT